MCNEILYFFECGHLAIEHIIEHCCYALNTFDRLVLLNYSRTDPRITENLQKCGENFKLVLRTVVNICQACRLDSSFKYPAKDTNMRRWPIEGALWLGENPSRSLQTIIQDERHTLPHWSLKMEGTTLASEAHMNWSLQTEEASQSGSPKEQSRFFWICENETIETLYTALRAPPERSSISFKQNRLMWIEEDPTLTPPSSPGPETRQTATVNDLAKTSPFGFKGEPFLFPPNLFWTNAAPLTQAENASAAKESRLPFLLEQLGPVPPYSDHTIRTSSARRGTARKGGFSNRDTAVSKVAKRRQYAGQQQSRWRVADGIVTL